MKYSEISKINRETERFIDNKEFLKALEYCDKVIELDGKYFRAYYNKGNIYTYLKEYDKALKCYNKAIELDGNYAYAYGAKANVYNVLQEYKKALLYCDKAIELDMHFVYAYNKKGDIYYKIKEYNQAILCYNQAIIFDNNYVAAYSGKANTYYRLRDYEKALEWYDKAIELDDKYIYAYNGKANTYYSFGDYEKALEWYDKAIELDDKYIYAYNGKANVNDALEKYYEAIQWYDEAIRLDKSFALAYKNRGNTFYKLNKYNKAINDYNKAIQLNPDYQEDLVYWIERCETELKEQKKNQQNEKREKISNVIDDIKDLLEYKEDQVCHYTSTFVFKELCKGSKLRFSHAALVNDPTEGKSLYDFLGVESIERKDQSGFLGSFVESHNSDLLPLWRAYGRDGEGVSICLDRKVLIEIITSEVIKEIEKSVNTEASQITRKLYKIAYVQSRKDEKNKEAWDFLIDGKKDENLEIKLAELKKLLQPLIDDKTVKNEEALEPVAEIQYLFKNAIYKGEREVRYYELLPNDYSQIKWDDSQELPTTYIEVENDIRNHIHNVTLGPKAKNATTWMALYKTMLAREGNKNVSVTQSKIPYR